VISVNLITGQITTNKSSRFILHKKTFNYAKLCRTRE